MDDIINAAITVMNVLFPLSTVSIRLVAGLLRRTMWAPLPNMAKRYGAFQPQSQQ